MDFSALMKTTTFRTGPAAERALPSPLRCPRPARQQQAAVKVIDDLLRALPGPGETTHCFLLGRTDLMDYLDSILSRLGPAQAIRLSTLSLAPRNIATMKRWLDSHAVEKLICLVSKFYRRHNPETYTALAEVLQSPHRAAASRTHAKLSCFHFQSGLKMVGHGSPNCRCNSNVEQWSLTADAALHDFFADFVDRFAESTDDAQETD
jgi:hypothetical protein